MSKFQAELPAVAAVLEASYAPGDIVARGGLAEAGNLLLQRVTERADQATAATYLAHVLQEVRIADIQEPITRESVTLAPLLDDLADPAKTPWTKPIRLVRTDAGQPLRPVYSEPTLETVADLPAFSEAGLFCGKNVLFVGMGGGSDVIQAAILSEYMQRTFGSTAAAFGSVRKAGNKLLNAELPSADSATLKLVGPQTTSQGDWRFLENIMLQHENDPSAHVPMYMINTLDTQAIERDVRILHDMYRPDVVVGVDTGGDSLRTMESGAESQDSLEATPDQDHSVLEALHEAELALSSDGTAFMTAIVAPGVDTPDDAPQKLRDAGYVRLPLTEADKAYGCVRYAELGMDGSGNQQNRFGKTALAFLAGLRGQRGLTMLNLPPAYVLSRDNPWRAAIEITPAMGEIVITRLARHYKTISR